MNARRVNNAPLAVTASVVDRRSKNIHVPSMTHLAEWFLCVLVCYDCPCALLHSLAQAYCCAPAKAPT